MNQRFDLHHIQRGIILSLATASPQKFSELQPPRLPNNTFSYHLKKLLETGYIKHIETGYELTRKGLKLIAVSGDQKSHIKAPALLTMLYITNTEGEALLINRNLDPFQGWYGLPSGAIHLGETVDEAARRELFEKTNIQADERISPIGILDFQYREKETDDLFIHAVAFLFSYQYYGGKSIIKNRQTKLGQLSWSKFGRKHILPEATVVKEMAETSTFMTKSACFIEPAHTPIIPLE